MSFLVSNILRQVLYSKSTTVPETPVIDGSFALAEFDSSFSRT